MSVLRGFFNSLYWKLSAVFLIVLTFVGTAYIVLSFISSDEYFAETNQRLNSSLAQHIVDDIELFPNGKPNLEAMSNLFHNVMVVNPSVEVYLLDAAGNILTYNAPKEKIKLTAVSLEPIRQFLTSDRKTYVLGDNPRDIHKPKVFSAAPAKVNGMVYGYIYVILGGEMYDSIAEGIQESHILGLSLRGLLVSFIAAGIIGLVALAFVTRKLRRIATTVMAFKEGNYSQRVQITSSDELDQLGSAFNEMATRIQNNVEELNHADALRRDLIANVSHDLRTPLASIQGYIETALMKNATLTTEQRENLLKTILSSSERLTRLVQELFELSKLEAKQSQPKPEPFSLLELVNDLLMKFAPHAEKNGVRLSTDTPRALPLVNGDIAMIERAMQNLIENAITHTPRGGAVKMTLSQQSANVRVEVADTGVGIHEDDIPFIFDRFYQASVRKKYSNGAGLGLAITKKILEAHGEDIAVESKANVGTIFMFELPTIT